MDKESCYVPMPFPRCPKCHKLDRTATHRNCGGALELNPLTESVRCTKCNHHWSLWDSKYYCSCGQVFSSTQVDDAIKEMLMICKLCLQDIREQQNAQRRRNELTETSIRGFVNGIFDKLGYAVGVAFETIVRTIWRFLF